MAQTDDQSYAEDWELLQKYPDISSDDLRKRFDLVTAQRILLAHARLIIHKPHFKITQFLYRRSQGVNED